MRRFAWFDCLRCLAILLVMFAHAGHYETALPPWLAAPWVDLQWISWVGVDLFFVLSGFLVSGLLFDEHDKRGDIDIKRFLIRRGFKIIPPFYFLILVTAIHDAIFLHGIDLVHLFHDIFFLQSYRIGAWGIAWTLSVEVHFYILLGLLLYILSRRSARQEKWLTPLPAIICGVLAFGFLARLINSGLHHGAFNAHREFWPSHLHLDVLAAGVLLRYLYSYHHEALAPFTRHKAVWLLLGLLLVIPSDFLWLPHHPALLTALIPTCNYLGFGLILFLATQVPFPETGWRAKVVAPFDYLGKHSYSIYLWHMPVQEWLINPFFHVPSPAFFVLFFIGSLAVGTFFSEVLEMPVLHFRNRMFPSASSRPSPAETPLPSA